MATKPGGRSLRFTAVEEFAVEEVAFSWHARFRFLGIPLRVIDRYAAGEGLLEARLLGVLPVMRMHGLETNEGEAMRYLAEVPWVPHAIHGNPQLSWREIDTTTVEVSTHVGSTRIAVELGFDAGGDVISAFAEARPHVEGKTIVPRPWRGEFGAYDVVGGVRLPTRAEVRWELPAGPFAYWKGTITSLDLSG